MHDFQEQLHKFRFLATVCFNKAIFIRFGFCDILNNQGLGKCYQHWPLAQLITHTCTSTLIIYDITKPSSNNILFIICAKSITHVSKTMYNVQFKFQGFVLLGINLGLLSAADTTHFIHHCQPNLVRRHK